MNKDKLRESLRGKITSFEQLREAYMAAGCDGYYNPADYGLLIESRPSGIYVGSIDQNFGDVRFTKDSAWWWYREQMRLSLGIYPARTSVLADVISGFNLHQYCIHSSTDPETPYAVAFTPDAVAGEADRQIKVSSLAKLIKKLCILVTDEHAGKIEAAHRAEMDPTFQIATTKEEIENVYRNMDGDRGCMRYDGDHWELPDGFHPSHVYAHPGVAVAYHTNVNGAIKSRAVIFELPDGTKGYLRIYGDNALKRKLEVNGYTQRSLADVKLAVIRLPEDTHGANRIVVPYIDGVGGNQDNYDGTYGYIDAADPDSLQLVSSSRASKLSAAGIRVDRFKGHTSVTYRVEPQDLSSIKFTCPLTGIEVDSTLDETLLVFHNGKVQKVLATGDSRRRFPSGCNFMIDGRWKPVRAAADVPSYNGHYLPDAVTHFNLVTLDPEVYPDGGYVTQAETTLIDGRRYRNGDTLRVYRADGTEDRVLRSAMKSRADRAAWVKDGYTIVTSGDYLIHADHPGAVTLHDGKVVHGGRHDIVTLYNGQQALSAGSRVITISGTSMRVPRGAHEIDRDKVIERVFDSRMPADCAAWMRRAADNCRETCGVTRRALTKLNEALVNRTTSTTSFACNRVRSLLGNDQPRVVDGQIAMMYLRNWESIAWQQISEVGAALDNGLAAPDGVTDDNLYYYRAIHRLTVQALEALTTAFDEEVAKLTPQVEAAEAAVRAEQERIEADRRRIAEEQEAKRAQLLEVMAQAGLDTTTI